VKVCGQDFFIYRIYRAPAPSPGNSIKQVNRNKGNEVMQEWQITMYSAQIHLRLNNMIRCAAAGPTESV